MQPIHNIVDDPPGDIVIRVGTSDSACLVRAHKMSSPGLKTLLAPGRADLAPTRTYFATTRQYTESDPLLLLADEPQAFIDFCTILHQQATGSREVPLHRLPAVAVVAEKYGCAERLRNTLAAPFHGMFDDGRTGDFDGGDGNNIFPTAAICVAYATDDARLFAKSTHWVVRHMGFRELAAVRRTNVTELVPPLLFQHLAAISETEMEKMEEAAHMPVWDTFMKTPYRAPCPSSIERLGKLTYHMCKVKKGKRSFKETMMSLEEVWEALRSVAEIVGPGSPLGGGCSEAPKQCSTGACLIDVQEALEDAVEESDDALKGLCLKCLRRDSLVGLLSCECTVEY
jgi:hypothetical protein